jgi:hypothetical protein
MIVESLVYFIFGSINLAYYIVHANGKKYIRLFSAIALFVLAGATFLADTTDTMHQVIWFKVVSMLSVLDTIVDWRGKIKTRGS